MVSRRNCYDLVAKGMPRVSKRSACLSSMVFITAPNKAAFKKVVKIVKGKCTGDIPLKKIKIERRYWFKAGDPIIFQGIPARIVKMHGREFLEVLIAINIRLYSYIQPYNKTCSYLKLTSRR